jgi:mannose-6-phosphate isomerase-like protein (cupin superfamily)
LSSDCAIRAGHATVPEEASKGKRPMKKIENDERIVANINSVRFKPFTAEGQEIAGQSYLQLDETFPQGAGFHIYRMAPGSSSQAHEHTCHEQFLILEGEVIDNDGYVYKPGDFVLLKQGTQHSSRTVTGATIAVFIREIERNL